MLTFTAELVCWSCGYVAAEISWRRYQPFAEARLMPSAAGPGIRRRPGERPCCGRCGGRLYFDAPDLATAVALSQSPADPRSRPNADRA